MKGSLINDYPDVFAPLHIEDDTKELNQFVIMPESFYEDHMHRCRNVVYHFYRSMPGPNHTSEHELRDLRWALSWIIGKDVTDPGKHDKTTFIYPTVKKCYMEMITIYPMKYHSILSSSSR